MACGGFGVARGFGAKSSKVYQIIGAMPALSPALCANSPCGKG